MMPGHREATSGSLRASLPPEPVVQTARLRLTRPCWDDVEAVFRIHADPRTYCHRPDLVMRRTSEAEQLVGDWCKHWDRDGIGYFTVSTRDGVTIGFTGVRRTVIAGQDALNLYYRFAPEHQGHGYASEAARAAIRWAQEREPRLPIVAAIDPSNAPSIRLATALGLMREPCEGGTEHDLYHLPPDPSRGPQSGPTEPADTPGRSANRAS